MFVAGFTKQAGMEQLMGAAKNIGGAVMKSAKNPAVIAAAKKNAFRGAGLGALAGGVQGAFSKDENGKSGGIGGALKGAAGGAVLGGAAGAASPFVGKGINRARAMVRKSGAGAPTAASAAAGSQASKVGDVLKEAQKARVG